MGEESDMRAIERAVGDVMALVGTGQEAAAVEKVVGFRSRGAATRDILIRSLISTGQSNRDAALTRCALSAFERIKKNAKLDAHYYYDVANGYQTLYELGIGSNGQKAFDMAEQANAAIKYFRRATGVDPRVETNLGNLLDSLARPLEALREYQAALVRDPNFAMAAGNYAYALEALTSSGQYPGGLLIMAHRLYQQALEHPASILEVGGQQALDHFLEHRQRIERYFVDSGHPEALHADLNHDPWDSSDKSEFVRFYTDLCLRHDLYLNLHLADPRAAASVGDTFLPTIVSPVESSGAYFSDLSFRLNEIHETFATARYLFARSQYVDADTRDISEQTTLINTMDYAVSNLYVGLLKSSYKEAFSALDKLAVLINHYLKIGHSEDSVYYGTVWFTPGTSRDEGLLSDAVRAGGYKLLGTYLLCLELRGSRYSTLRNAMTHRYVRVFRGTSPEKGGYDFEHLVQLTAEVLFKVKCAIIYTSQFIMAQESRKSSGQPVGTVPIETDQNLDLWD